MWDSRTLGYPLKPLGVPSVALVGEIGGLNLHAPQPRHYLDPHYHRSRFLRGRRWYLPQSLEMVIIAGTSRSGDPISDPCDGNGRGMPLHPAPKGSEKLDGSRNSQWGGARAMRWGVVRPP